jgi:hypothetical protein
VHLWWPRGYSDAITRKRVDGSTLYLHNPCPLEPVLSTVTSHKHLVLCFATIASLGGMELCFQVLGPFIATLVCEQSKHCEVGGSVTYEVFLCFDPMHDGRFEVEAGDARSKRSFSSAEFTSRDIIIVVL